MRTKTTRERVVDLIVIIIGSAPYWITIGGFVFMVTVILLAMATGRF